MRKFVLALAIGTALWVSSAASAKAQDAEFGCKVLLCAAASNPSWPSIPYCVPVMNQLHAMMRSIRFRWPVCTAAGTGAPGYEPYLPCPEGWQETSSNTGGSGENGAGSYPGYGGNDLCARRLLPRSHGGPLQASVPGRQIQCPASGGENGGMIGSGQDCIESMPRQRNERPYYFDMRNANGGSSRIWFFIR